MKSFVKNLIKLVCFALVLMPAILFCGCEVEQKTNNSGMKRAEVTSEKTANAESGEIADDFDDEFENFEDEGPLYNITVDPSSNNSIIQVFPGKTKAYKGDIVHVSYTINENFVVDKITANGVAISYGYFIVGEEDVVVKAFIKPKNEVVDNETFDIIIEGTQSDKISITPSKLQAQEGELISLNCFVEQNWSLNYLTLNGQRLDDSSFQMPAKDVVIDAVLSQMVDEFDHSEQLLEKHKITLDRDIPKTIEITLDKTSAACGETVGINVNIKDSRYSISSFIINDYYSISGNKTSFVMPYGDVKLSVCFSFNAGQGDACMSDIFWWMPGDEIPLLNYFVELGSVEGIRITPSVSMANYCDKVTLDYQVKPGYELCYFTVNGEKIEGNTFRMPMNNAVVGAVVKNTQNTSESSGVSVIDGEIAIDFSELFLDKYNISTISFHYIKVTTSKTSTYAGNTVEISYELDDEYELKYFTVKGSKISGTSFIMPEEDVQVYAVCSKKSSALNSGTSSQGVDNFGYWKWDDDSLIDDYDNDAEAIGWWSDLPNGQNSDDYDNVVGGNGNELDLDGLNSDDYDNVVNVDEEIDLGIGSGDNYIGGENGIGQIGEIDENENEEETGEKWSPVIPLH